MTIDYTRMITADDKSKARAAEAEMTLQTAARALLAATDWMVIRAAEGGDPVPAETLAARQEARAALSS